MKKYLRILIIEFKKIKEYSLNFLGQLLFFPVQFLIIFLLWKFIYLYNDSIASYTFYEIVSYYFILKILETAIMPAGITAYEQWNDINKGNLDIYLSKPLNYPLYLFFTKVGYFIWNMILGLGLIYVTKLFVPLTISLEIGTIIIALTSAFLGLIILFNLFFIVGTLTFWVENILTLRDNLWNVIKILSGQLFPIAMFPVLLQNISEALPFQNIYYVPITIMEGKIHGSSVFELIGTQFVWVVVMSIFSSVVWTVGKKRYAGQGG